MKMPFFILFFISCNLIKVELVGQQLMHKTTFSTLDFGLNPAMTAPAEILKAGTYYRQQWADFNNAPRLAIVSGQFPLVNLNMSIGGYLLHEEINLLNTNELVLTYSYKMKIGLTNKDQLSIGLMGNITQTFFNSNDAIVSSESDALLMRERDTHFDVNFGAGFFYTSNKDMLDNDDKTFFLGMSALQLLSVKDVFYDDSFSKKRVHANALLGVRIPRDFTFIEPSVGINYAVNSPLNLRATVLFEQEETFWTGLTYQTDNTIEFQLGVILKLGDGFLRLGGMGGYNIRSMGKERGFGYEFLMSYQFEL